MRRWMVATAASVVLGAAAALAGAGGEDPAEIEPGGVEFGRFLFFATLEGVCEDGLSESAVKHILETDEKGNYRNFVYACPVCSPVVEGFRAYAMRDKIYYGRKGDPLTGNAASPAGIAASARLETPGTRGAALSDLVKRYVDQRMDRLRLTEPERKAWRRAMELGRKKGMGRLQSSDGFAFKSCPSCDGSCDAPWESK